MLITECPRKRLSVGHRRENMFDWFYFLSLFLRMYSYRNTPDSRLREFQNHPTVSPYPAVAALTPVECYAAKSHSAAHCRCSHAALLAPPPPLR